MGRYRYLELFVESDQIFLTPQVADSLLAVTL